ncbi:hypothetical protein DTO164E3_4684 [Paecilomyces variotii]|uniref:COX assembly mitochondrial protein n=1 Tax=Byssochlamys spectabilis TaxID=264951 RepID=A0A443HK31_BYSSP|nr:cytochrome c oxidase biogenesis protein Cmc1 like-domain-containing protein [Paecilomyces variotii]KAJ9199372.1 hypothetical protein DTO164E3_4684 [Paecilomyces variotii]KAJ9204536.1 hypothetical protein DTO032I3_2791 [Paecilomyces variotii]KAJ9224148.1 hypothetical protein DTO169C6_3508 [Paecilomyces variotii]KAJ9235173.1 hypothetical protein DTO166G5_4722 [Paecilomyces variotii]KAJ9248716.1 hypothetical protein DTO207G8_7200 [Paecilomyces variotii]
MATASASQGTTPNAPGPQLNLRNPVPLSAAQEQQVKELYHKRVRGYCAKEIKEFAQCAVNRTVTATWVCRQQRLAMNACMLEHAKPEEEDRAREEWFLKREERRREKEQELAAVEKRRLEVIQMMREDQERRRKLREQELQQKR